MPSIRGKTGSCRIPPSIFTPASSALFAARSSALIVAAGSNSSLGPDWIISVASCVGEDHARARECDRGGLAGRRKQPNLMPATHWILSAMSCQPRNGEEPRPRRSSVRTACPACGEPLLPTSAVAANLGATVRCRRCGLPLTSTPLGRFAVFLLSLPVGFFVVLMPKWPVFLLAAGWWSLACQLALIRNTCLW